MKYTVADGTLIYHDKRVTYFKFHGSPDIIIDKKGGEVHAAYDILKDLRYDLRYLICTIKILYV